MKRLSFFNSTRAWGGGEKWHLDTGKYLAARGYTVRLWAHREGVLFTRASEAGLEVRPVRMGNLSFLNPWKVGRLMRAFRNEKPDVLVLNLSRDLKLAGLAARWAGIPRIIYRRGSDIPVRNTWLNRLLFKNIPTDVLVNSKATASSLLRQNPDLFPENRIRIIYNGIVTAGTPECDKPLQRERSPLVLKTLGRLEVQKNHGFLLEVAAELEKRGLDFILRIGGEGSLRQSLEAKRAALGLQERVFLDGFIDDPIAYIGSADIFLLGSLWEGFGYVLAEAGLCAKPVVALAVSSNPEVVRNGVTGFLTPPGDIGAFAGAVEVLMRDPELRRNMGAAGRERVIRDFDQDRNLKAIENYLIGETNRT